MALQQPPPAPPAVPTAGAAAPVPAPAAPQPQPQQQQQQQAPATVPCAYKTGRTLGQGTYAVVKEAVHIKTGKYYACKVISKRLMEGREHMVRNEIAALKRVSQGHKSIVTLVDYFETMNNLYLVTDLCVGGELFDRICERGSYYEQDAAHIVRTIVEAVGYLHTQGIVHRDLKPENLLFRDKSEDSDLLIADFGLSRVVDDEKMTVLSTTCGTPGYMAPEIFKKTGHGKPVDMWAIGVITYFLLCGYTPFDRDSTMQEMQAIVHADYRYEPEVYWRGVSSEARHFIDSLLVVDPSVRLTAPQALSHAWLARDVAHGVAPLAASSSSAAAAAITGDAERPAQRDLLPEIKSAWNAKRAFRGAVHGVVMLQRLKGQMAAGGVSHDEVRKLREGIAAAEVESNDVVDVLPQAQEHHHQGQPQP